MGGKRALWSTLIVGLLTVLCPARGALGQQAPSGVGGIGDPAVVPTEDTLDTTYGLAMGAGARAGAVGVSALAYNTSNMAAVSTYDVEAPASAASGPGKTGDTAAGIGAPASGSRPSHNWASG